MSRDINRILLPGEEIAVQATGDYVYCKAATVPVHLALDQQVVEMVAGDKLREPSRFKSFRLENRSADTVAHVTLVVGEGDYMRQIVQGELAVEPKLMTEDGTLREDSRYWLSLFIRPEPGYTPQTYDLGDTVAVFHGIAPEAGFANNEADMEFDESAGRFVMRDTDGTWFEYSPEWDFIESRTGPAPSTGANYKFTIDRSGWRVWTNTSDGLYYAPRYGNDPDNAIPVSTPAGSRYNDEIMRIGDRLYYVDNRQVYSTPVEQAAGGSPDWAYHGELPMGGNLASDGKSRLFSIWPDHFYVFDLESADPMTPELFRDGIASDAGDAVAYHGGLVYGWDAIRDRVEALWPREQETVSVKATAEPLACRPPAGMIDAADWQYTRAELNARAGRMGALDISGEVIRAALALYTGNGEAPAGYLDHVYAVRMNSGTGQGAQAIRANQTFAAAGVADDFRMTIPGAIHIQIDAQLFNE